MPVVFEERDGFSTACSFSSRTEFNANLPIWHYYGFTILTSFHLRGDGRQMSGANFGQGFHTTSAPSRLPSPPLHNVVELL